MPLYEYRCADCDRRLEVLQRMGETAEGLACPTCGSAHLDRLCSTFAATVGGGREVADPGGCACAGPGEMPMGGCCRLPA